MRQGVRDHGRVDGGAWLWLDGEKRHGVEPAPDREASEPSQEAELGDRKPARGGSVRPVRGGALDPGIGPMPALDDAQGAWRNRCRSAVREPARIV